MSISQHFTRYQDKLGDRWHAIKTKVLYESWFADHVVYPFADVWNIPSRIRLIWTAFTGNEDAVRLRSDIDWFSHQCEMSRLDGKREATEEALRMLEDDGTLESRYAAQLRAILAGVERGQTFRVEQYHKQLRECRAEARQKAAEV